MTNIFKTHTAKQLLGAGAGMAIATLVYIGVDQVSNVNIKGLLVSTETVSGTTDLNINAKNVNDATLRRIAGRAQTVATTLQHSLEPTQAETPLTNFASSRRDERIVEDQLAALAATAKTYSNDPNVVMSEEDRLAIRAARIAGLPAPDVAPKPVREVYVPRPADVTNDELFIAEPLQVVSAESLPSHAEMTKATSQNSQLPSSGLGLHLLILTTLAFAFALSKTTWRRDLASMILGLRIG